MESCVSLTLKLLLLITTFTSAAQSDMLNPPTITIGAVLSSKRNIEIFENLTEELNSGDPTVLPRFNASGIIMDENPIHAAEHICDNLIPNNVYVVIASHPPSHYDMSPMAVSFTCGFYKIPVIGISSRDSVFSDKNVHMTFMRTVPPYSSQSEVWVHMLNHFAFKRTIFIHSSTQEGRAVFGSFQTKAEADNIKIEKSVCYEAGQRNYSSLLFPLRSHESRVILLYASTEDAEVIFQEAIRLNLTGAGYVWIVTEQALNATSRPLGTLGLRLMYSQDENFHIADSLQLIQKTFRHLYSTTNITQAPNGCLEDPDIWHSGQLIFNTLVGQRIENGRTGRVMFSVTGDRLGAAYEVVNVQVTGEVPVGTYRNTALNPLSMDGSNNIVWPGGEPTKPKGVKVFTDLKVVTIEAIPFVYTSPASSAADCEPELNRIWCPHTNLTTGKLLGYCCFGYAIDLLDKLSKTVNFTYNLHRVYDGTFGSYERGNDSTQRWSGMIGEVVNGQADLVVAPLTIDPERATHIDFSKPFKYQGLTILVKKTAKDSSLGSFLQPFEDTLWILVGLSVHVVALVLYLLDRFSPFGRFKLAKSDDTEEDALNLSSAMWFAWGVLLNSGIGEGTPRSFSARVLGMVWAGFAMIIVASYTANLAAFLVLDRPEASISGIDDARLRNPQDNFIYATVKGSAVSMYFKRQVELSTMYRFMELYNYDEPEDAIAQVRNGELQAFIWDSSRLKYEAAKDCDLTTAGELFGRSGYGIGLQKDSPWTQDISLQILTFHESGYMEQLDGKWVLVKDTNCPDKENAPATLGLTNMAGVFMMVAGGIVAGVFLIFIEIAYKKHRGLKEKELELAKTAADRWRGNIEKRKLLRQSWHYLRHQTERFDDSGSSLGTPSSPQGGMLSIPSTLSLEPSTQQSTPSLQPNTARYNPPVSPYLLGNHVQPRSVPQISPADMAPLPRSGVTEGVPPGRPGSSDKAPGNTSSPKASPRLRGVRPGPAIRPNILNRDRAVGSRLADREQSSPMPQRYQNNHKHPPYQSPGNKQASRRWWE